MAKELTTEDTEAFDSALGKFVREWSGSELVIDLIVCILRKPKDRLPHQLTAKIRFIRLALPSRVFSQAKELLQLIDEIECAAETRHAYVHGAAFFDAPEQSRLVVSMMTFLQPPGQRRRRGVAALIGGARCASEFHWPRRSGAFLCYATIRASGRMLALDGLSETVHSTQPRFGGAFLFAHSELYILSARFDDVAEKVERPSSADVRD